jgi:carboxypeptidase Taq
MNISPKILNELRIQKNLQGVVALLSWDEQVMMPASAQPQRSEQVSLIAKWKHERLTEERFVTAVREESLKTSLTDEEQAIIRELKRDVDRATLVPSRLVEEISKTESDAHAAWLRAREERSFKVVTPVLKSLLTLKKEYASAISPELSNYDALLDTFEPGLRHSTVEELFNPLKDEFLKLLPLLTEKQQDKPIKLPTHWISKDDQNKFFIELVKEIGFDISRGRCDETVHPFCSEITYDDVRLTTRFDEMNILHGLFAALHEAGHGMYEQGFLEKNYYTPLSEACSLAVHESQSLFWDKQIGHSAAYLSYLSRMLKSTFRKSFERLTADDLFWNVNRVSPSMFRLKSDEISYGLHIILRTELESKVIGGDLQVDDLPSAWSEKMKRYFGLTPKDDLEGVLQDTHWYIGAWGYFPTYLIGALYAAQLFSAASSAVRNSQDKIQSGDFSELLSWLRKSVHQHGKFYSSLELITTATSNPPSSKYFLDYIHNKYR